MNAFDQAAKLCEQRKIELSQAQSALLDAEQKMLALMPSKDEGSVTERGLHFKVTATFGMNRTIDEAALESVRAAMPEALFEYAFGYKPTLKLQGLRYLENNERDAYLIAAQAITAKPAKPSVKVEAVQVLREAA